MSPRANGAKRDWKLTNEKMSPAAPGRVSTRKPRPQSVSSTSAVTKNEMIWLSVKLENIMPMATPAPQKRKRPR